ncbi:MAG: hypothetical protein C0621_09085 [Desulfuromonas sp.]|nr:MAG: hypothetical protein C0621_09085 [Desulfuromonas sp.]
MEDLWKVEKLGFRIVDVAERAEYDRIVKRFREEEESTNRRNLLFGEITLEASIPASEKEGPG